MTASRRFCRTVGILLALVVSGCCGLPTDKAAKPDDILVHYVPFDALLYAPIQVSEFRGWKRFVLAKDSAAARTLRESVERSVDGDVLEDVRLKIEGLRAETVFVTKDGGLIFFPGQEERRLLDSDFDSVVGLFDGCQF